MIAIKNPRVIEEIVVVHPLFDAPEEKHTGEGLGFMPMSKPVRVCLLLLRGYLICMFLLIGFHVLDMAGAFGRHVR